ncbi:pyruvate ferredoxin oxidoreductase [Stygiolobus caldivivus]|uniref:2-oxoacid oxidoreductase (ferredoxin) n=1 Tax=Stygiolobus caldivivus TaxID=2824673 RepID=A0A8D5U4F6_9CREN|nr:pyruvate ferredoxin oxidoreductase [Stygiolobus caldivivus]BCU68918.1 pyruvate ferredoxin oxidoreductase [Stygiolobus caldivivus]
MMTVQNHVTAMVGNHAVAYAVKQAKPSVLAVFPITPQTTMLEKLAEYIEKGELKAELIKVEGEHSAMAAVYGAAVAGARVFTATSSQGLLYMTEMVYWVGGERVPIVNAVATRAIAEPWSIWDDHQDFFSKRDASWIMMMAENVQDAYDMTLQAFRISEDKRVLLPVMMGFDGFILTHTMERLMVLDDEIVDKFLPPREFSLIDFKDPVNVGPIAAPDDYMKIKYETMKAINGSKAVIEEISKDYEKITGRKQYGLVECYMCEDAEYVFTTSGAWTGDAREAVRRLRNQGKKVGLLKIRVIRPFPKERIKEVLKGVSGVVTFDREYSFGSGGVLATEVKASLYNSGIEVMSVIAGIGGKDVRPSHFQRVMEDVLNGHKFEERWLNE